MAESWNRRSVAKLTGMRIVFPSEGKESRGLSDRLSFQDGRRRGLPWLRWFVDMVDWAVCPSVTCAVWFRMSGGNVNGYLNSYILELRMRN